MLRVADTDAKRVTDENYQAVLEDMAWLGLEWDEGPEIGGPHGPYRQSERAGLYRAAAEKLVASDSAYRCYCTPDELEERRKVAQAERKTPGYDGRCRHLGEAERAAFEAEGRSFALRFAVPEDRALSFDDIVLGTITTASEQIPDFIIQRSDGSPTYMLAVTVDDADMQISHIIRGNDLVASTPRQLLLREAMGIAEVPKFAHLPLLVSEAGKPLSKRWGDVSVRAYRDQGFLREAMVNYLALLGWSYDDKTNIFSAEELIQHFSLERVGKNPAAFDVAKLEWLNLHYIKNMDPDRLMDELVSFCERAGIPAGTEEGRAKLRQVVPLMIERLRRLDEAPPMVRFLFARQEPDEKAKKVLAGQEGYLTAARAALDGLETWSAASIEAALRALAAERGLKPKQAFQPIRAAVTGTLVSPPLFESLEILGRSEALVRLDMASRPRP